VAKLPMIEKYVAACLHKLHGIEHRLIKPYTPRTNGMIERFNGRIADIIKTTRFASSTELENNLKKSLDLRRHLSLIPQKALGHKTALEALHQWHEKAPECFRARPPNFPRPDKPSEEDRRAMKTSLFSQSLFALPLAQAIATTAETGFDAIELACTRPHFDEATTRRNPESAAEMIRRAGLEVAALSLSNNFTDQARLASELQSAETFIALAPLFGTRIVKMTPGPPASAKAAPEHWACLADAVAHLVPLATEAGVVLAFETHMRQLTDTLASSLRFLDSTPADAVGLTVDFSNLRFANESMSKAIPALQGRMFHAHVKNGRVDGQGGWRFGPLDAGLTDYAEVIALLRQAGYDGYLSVECLGPDAQTHPAETARRDLTILKRYLEAAP